MLKLEPRPQASKFWSLASPLLALAITVVLGTILFIALGKDPVQGLRVFFWEPISSGYRVGELMVKATPLLLIALGLAVCFRSNVWNIGAEGQFIIGAVFAGGVALLADKETSRWIVLAVLLAGVLGGMVWAGITAFLRDRFNANEILVSLMLVYVAVQVLNYLVFGPWKDPAGYNFPQSKTFESVTQIPRLVQGSSITQTYQFVSTGAAELGFVALSQAVAQKGGSRWLVPASLHSPIEQQAVVLKIGARNPAATAFAGYLKSPEARAVIRKYGYEVK